MGRAVGQGGTGDGGEEPGGQKEPKTIGEPVKTCRKSSPKSRLPDPETNIDKLAGGRFRMSRGGPGARP